MATLINANPLVHEVAESRDDRTEYDEAVADPIDEREIFDLIRTINDPEHPLTLEELDVVKQAQIYVDHKYPSVKVEFTPTIPHCSMAMLIGLSIRVRLLRTLSSRFKIDVAIHPGTHNSEHAVNKQLADKERVAAALENQSLVSVVNDCLTSKKN